MKPGKAITYVDALGDHHEATCTAVLDDVSPSGAKVLDLTTEDGDVVTAVPYVADRVDGDGYWQLTTDS